MNSPAIEFLEPRRLCSAAAVPVPVVDPGFDTLYAPGSTIVTATLPAGAMTAGAGPGAAVVNTADGKPAVASYSNGTSGTSVDVPGWTGYADQPVGIAGPGNAFPGKPDNYAFVGAGFAIRQILAGLMLQPDTTYVLTARVGAPAGTPVAAIEVALSGSGLEGHPPATFGPPVDGFSTVTTYARSAVRSPTAADVSIVLGTVPLGSAGPASLSFDDVTLTAVPATPPAATFQAPDVTSPGGATETITVNYADETPVQVSSIAPGNLTVTAPDGRPLAVTGVVASPAAGYATAVTATYTVAAPAGGWGAADDGVYTVALQPGQVIDAAGTAAAAAATSFAVNIASATPTPAPAPVPTPAPVPLPAGTLTAMLKAGVPPAVVAGARSGVTATVTLTNPGAAPLSGPATVTLYVSPTGSLDGATEVATLTRPLRLPPGRSRLLRVRLPAFPFVLDGAYTLLAAVRAPDGTLTAAAGPALRIAAPFVAVRPSALRVLPPAASPGRRVAVLLTVSDLGNEPVDGTAPLSLLAAPEAGGSAGLSLAKVSLRVKLKPGATRTYRVKFVLPLLSPTTYAVTASLGVGALGDTDDSDATAAPAAALVVS